MFAQAKKRAVKMGALIAFLIFLGHLGLAEAAPIQITNQPANQGRPDVYGNTIVWKDYRFGTWDIFKYTLPGGPELDVMVEPSYQNLPVTNGSVVVWQDNRTGDNDIWMRDVDGGAPQLLIGGPGHQILPEISGDKVVYVDSQGPGTNTDPTNNIYMIDINDPQGQPTPVCTYAASQWQPRISGNRVVWQDFQAGKWEIYYKNISTPGSDPVPVSTAAVSQDVADIDRDIVVWRDYRDDGNGHLYYDIWMKNLTTGATGPVTSDAAYQTNPRISGDLVIWDDYRNDQNGQDTYYDYDVYMKDLTSGQESGLATGTMIQAKPAIDRETVVWEAYSPTSGSGYDIWMAYVPDETAPVISGLTPADGASPGCLSPSVSATFTDNRAGIDVSSVGLEIDGNDVTGSAGVTETGIAYQTPSDLPEGSHTASLTVADLSGNTTSTSWQFTTASPVSGLSMVSAYWASMADYENRELSLRFRLTNTSAEVPVNGMEILGSTPTAGVVLTSATPLTVGDIQPGGSVEVVLEYSIPPGTAFFKTSIYAGCSDNCGRYYFFPGPPPGY